ncbi:MAG: hypothetical protein EBQ85_08730 [Proteobacteria bacterium]|nr:hypothetical protein [Pseudomonadota bacterium]
MNLFFVLMVLGSSLLGWGTEKTLLSRIDGGGDLYEFSETQSVGNNCIARRKWIEIEGRPNQAAATVANDILREEITVGKRLDRKHCPPRGSQLKYEFSNEIVKTRDWYYKSQEPYRPIVRPLGLRVTVKISGKSQIVTEKCIGVNLLSGDVFEINKLFKFQWGTELSKKMRNFLGKNAPLVQKNDEIDRGLLDWLEKSLVCATEQGLLISPQNITIPPNIFDVSDSVQYWNNQLEGRDSSQGDEIQIVPQELKYQATQERNLSDRPYRIFIPQVTGSNPDLVKRVSDLIAWEQMSSNAASDSSSKQKITLKTKMEDEAFNRFYAAYSVLLNSQKVLCVQWHESTNYAYPDDHFYRAVISLETGKKLGGADAFDNLQGLLSFLHKDQIRTINEKIAEHDGEGKDFPEYTARFQRKDLDYFYINEQGIFFEFRYAFPHASRAAAPQEKFFYSWSQIKPFIKRTGPLAPFVSG